MPSGIVVDTRVIGSAPPNTLGAGVGGLVSNLTAILDWELADRVGMDRYDAFSAMIAESAARPIMEIDDLTATESHELVAKGLLLSGLAMAAAGTSRPCSGAEHLISHSLDSVLGKRAALHGEQVALGALFSAAAHDSPLLPALRTLFERLGLPTDQEALAISDEELVGAIRAAPATRPARFTILSPWSRRAAWVRSSPRPTSARRGDRRSAAHPGAGRSRPARPRAPRQLARQVLRQPRARSPRSSGAGTCRCAGCGSWTTARPGRPASFACGPAASPTCGRSGRRATSWPLLRTPGEVIEALRVLDGVAARCSGAYDRFVEKFCHLEDGHASARFVEAAFGR